MFEHLPTKRRNILRWLVAVGLTAFAAPFAFAVGKFLAFQGAFAGNKTAKLSAAELTPDSPSKLVEIEGEPVIVVREADNSIRAFTATCTHLACIVSYRPQMPGFYCKCHGGKYDVNGVNVPGTRPKSPLTELVVNQQADDLEVSLAPKNPAA
ncbi:MAG: Rieske (2Fe-2S) protein [Bacteroidota bacterium]|nr:Rieske (2Fe-2S) protein [Bacteroidota bacterium]MDP4234612.1 Rieske (2Fe-2S) protein [Bacteroidota bacterium]MDP4243789.1 Rieske (2Fe-2S) protein [Bacteroidota bacterium]MDP4288973.1 Rieske (2Fe-2S) protein [Bacteroidota bacterium]